jgi:hypothetical protein
MSDTRRHQIRVRIVQFAMICAFVALIVGRELWKSSADMDVSGGWSYSDTRGTMSTLTIVQSDNAAIIGAGTDGATISGLVDGRSIAFVFSWATNTATMALEGTISSNTNRMSGTFTNSLEASGTWEVVRINKR